MKYISTQILVFIMACLGWTLILDGWVVAGIATLLFCFVISFIASVLLSHGTFKNLFDSVTGETDEP